MRKRLAFVFAVGLGLVLASSRFTPITVPVDARVDPVDAWLTAHPAVANVMIWEFPPPKILRVAPKRFLVWVGPLLPLDLGQLLPLTDDVFPDRTVRDEIDSAPRLTALSADFDINAIGNDPSALQTPVPGNVPDWLPGGIKTSEYGAEIRAWSKWPEWAKEELRQRFAAYNEWAGTACVLYADYAASGFEVKPEGFDAAFTTLVDLDPAPVFDPPNNIQPDDPLVSGIPWSMFTSSDAFKLYVRHVAAQLALEINNCLPWSVLDYPSSDLTQLFDGRQSFRYVTKGPSAWGEMSVTGHVLTGGNTPAPPLVVLGFLAQNALIGSDRTDTVSRLFEWERTELRHTIGGTVDPPLPSGILYWGYNGREPVSRMINGTVMADGIEQSNGSTFFDPEVRHWTGGCGGTSAFSGAVLRTVNIAAHRTSYAHFQNRFALDAGVYMGIGHADDPYALLGAPEIPAVELLIDDATFHEWFVNEPDPAEKLKKVGRRKANLYLQYLPEVLLKKHCNDLAFAVDHANSKVYNFTFASTYTVAELEALGLWTGIEAKLATLGGCAIYGW